MGRHKTFKTPKKIDKIAHSGGVLTDFLHTFVDYCTKHKIAEEAVQKFGKLFKINETIK